jgi:hypothetical protein
VRGLGIIFLPLSIWPWRAAEVKWNTVWEHPLFSSQMLQMHRAHCQWNGKEISSPFCVTWTFFSLSCLCLMGALSLINQSLCLIAMQEREIRNVNSTPLFLLELIKVFICQGSS